MTTDESAANTGLPLENLQPNNGRSFFPRGRFRNSPAAGLKREDPIKVLRVESLQLRVPPRRIPDMDALLRRVGSPGRYQVLTFLALSLTSLVIAPNNLAVVFWGAEPAEYLCVDRTPTVENLLPFDNRTMTYEDYSRWTVIDGRLNSNASRQCTVLMTVPETFYSELYYCRAWTFPDAEDATIVTDFQLVCGETGRVTLSTTIYFLGLMIGALLFGFLADRYGRRVVVLISGAVAVLFGVGTSFSGNYSTFVALRFFLAILLQGMQVSFVLIVEWLPVERRSFYGALSQLMWSVGVMFLGFLGFLFPSWNDLQLAISLVGLLLLMAYFFLLEESIRWLLVKNKVDAATETALKVLRFNRISSDMSWEMEHELLSCGTFLKEHQEPQHHYTFVDCFRTPVLRKVSFCMMYIWFAYALAYYGLFLSIERLVPSLALNTFINGVLELIPCVISVLVIPRYGRKQPMIIFNFLGGFVCILSCLVRGNTSSPLAGRTALTVISRMALTGSSCSFFIWSAELYPTILRANGIGVGMFAFRLGGVLAPQLLALGPHTFDEFPIIVLGIIALGGVVAAYPLPETVNVNLPDTVTEAENFGCKASGLRKSNNTLGLSTLSSVRMSQISSQ